MARRMNLSSKKQPATSVTTAQISETPALNMPRRGRKAKSKPTEQAEPSLTDFLFPSGEEPAASDADAAPNPPSKARRGRKPKVLADAETIAVTETDGRENTAPAETDQSFGIVGQQDLLSGSGDTPPESVKIQRRRKKAQAGPSSADVAAAPSTYSPSVQWNAETGTATFNWPSIEQVAATDGPNQTMAKCC